MELWYCIGMSSWLIDQPSNPSLNYTVEILWLWVGWHSTKTEMHTMNLNFMIGQHTYILRWCISYCLTKCDWLIDWLIVVCSDSAGIDWLIDCQAEVESLRYCYRVLEVNIMITESLQFIQNLMQTNWLFSWLIVNWLIDCSTDSTEILQYRCWRLVDWLIDHTANSLQWWEFIILKSMRMINGLIGWLVNWSDDGKNDRSIVLWGIDWLISQTDQLNRQVSWRSNSHWLIDHWLIDDSLWCYFYAERH